MNTDRATNTQLPASAFPEPAEVYICDNCGRDITRHLPRQQSPSSRAIGPQRYACACGQGWLTGLAEWDHMEGWERRNQIRGTVLLSIILSVLATLTYLVLRYLFSWGGAGIAAAIIAALPSLHFTF